MKKTAPPASPAEKSTEIEGLKHAQERNMAQLEDAKKLHQLMEEAEQGTQEINDAFTRYNSFVERGVTMTDSGGEGFAMQGAHSVLMSLINKYEQDGRFTVLRSPRNEGAPSWKVVAKGTENFVEKPDIKMVEDQIQKNNDRLQELSQQ